MRDFCIWASPDMGYATTISDIDPVAARILGRDRPTAFEAVVIATAILLSTAAIAGCITFATEWIRTAHLQSDSHLKRSIELARGSEMGPAPVATTVPDAAAFLFVSPFASKTALLFLPEPVGTEELRQNKSFSVSATEQPPADRVVNTPLPERAPSDQDNLQVPLPPSRPYDHKPMQAANGSVDSSGTAGAPKTLTDASSTAPSKAIAFLKNLFHFWQTRDDVKLPPEADAHTAVYDIEGHVVYMPNGKKLEAHSGYGKSRDDIRYVSEKSRGPTPPNVYRLALRTSLFHGVQAIRLNPVDSGKMFGRRGMLAHPYMLGPDGQSNGCISVKDYPKFLEAFENGEINRLIVVPHLDGTPSYVAAAVTQADNQYASR
jgi:hypothetical protein